MGNCLQSLLHPVAAQSKAAPDSVPAEPAHQAGTAESTSVSATSSTGSVADAVKPAPAPAPAPAAAAAQPKKLDPKDFILSGRQGETIVRAPGSIQGQQFVIEECKDCTIYLLDHSAQVTVDLCTNCRVFIGPCESSVFLRDCTGCKVVVAAQQLRLRDCNQLDMLVYVSAGQPSIESCTGIRIGCFNFSYFALAEQFRKAGLSVWSNDWSNVHDFTAKAGEVHWQHLDEASLLAPACEVCADISPAECELACPVPLTQGCKPYDRSTLSQLQFILACSSPASEDGLIKLITALQQSKQGIVTRASSKSLTAPELKQVMAGAAGWVKAPAGGASKPGKAAVIGLELALTQEISISTICQQLNVPTADSSAPAAGDVLCVCSTTAEANAAAKVFFEQFKSKV